MDNCVDLAINSLIGKGVGRFGKKFSGGARFAQSTKQLAEASTKPICEVGSSEHFPALSNYHGLRELTQDECRRVVAGCSAGPVGFDFKPRSSLGGLTEPARPIVPNICETPSIPALSESVPLPKPEGIDLRKRVRKNTVPDHRVIYESYTGKKPIGQVHHGLPQELRPWLLEKGINIDCGEYYFDLPQELHNRKPNGIHTNSNPLGDNWNKIWRDYMKRRPDATKEQILDQLDKMAHDAGIEQYRAVKKGSN